MADAVLVRLPDSLVAPVYAAAAGAGLTVPAWLRARAVEAVGADPADVRPSAPRHGLPPEGVVAVARLRESVAEAVGALVRSAAFVRGDLAEAHADLESLIPRFRGAALDLDRLKAALLDGAPSPS